MPANETAFLEKLASVKRWTRGYERAPHKPLLLLMAMARAQRNESRLVQFVEIEYDLRALIERFGPSRKSYHPEFPFWHLQSDELWEIPGKILLTPKKGGSSPTAASLRDNCAEGGMPREYYDLLKKKPDLIARAARTVLNAHFPDSLHEDLLAAVGLTLETPEQATGRDPQFRSNVLLAYEYRCAVCGYNARMDNMPIGLEAAHVKWHSHNGPSTVDNGLCLCTLHHKAFDLGAIGISLDDKILISARLNGGEQIEKVLTGFSGMPVIGPQRGQPPVAEAYRAWHLENCFKPPARDVWKSP